jgi:hypothetical protein
MSRSIWVIRILFLAMCTMFGYAISQVRPELLNAGLWWTGIGFGLGSVLIAIDEMLKGFSLRAFSAATFGLLLGTLMAWMVDNSQLFIYVDEETTRWLIRLSLFVCFGYLGMVLAMRSNKEDFSLIIPFVRLSPQNKPEDLLLLDTSVIVDGRIADLIEANFLEGTLVVPRFVLKEVQTLADSHDTLKRARGKRGLEVLSRIRTNSSNRTWTQSSWSWPGHWARSFIPTTQISPKWRSCNPCDASTSTNWPAPSSPWSFRARRSACAFSGEGRTVARRLGI